MDNFLYSLEGFPVVLLYLILSMLMCMEYVIPFVPGDTFLAFSAYLAGIGILNLRTTFFVAVGANIVGFGIIYYIAFRWGEGFFERRNYKFLHREKIERVKIYFKKYGYWLILINRFLPGTRFFIALTAGLSRMNFKMCLLLNTLSIALWSSLLIFIGVFVGKNWEQIRRILSRYNLYVTLGVVLFIVVFLAYRAMKSKKSGVRVG